MADVASLIPQAGAVLAGKASGIGNLLAGILAGRQAKKLQKTPLEDWKKMMGFQEYEVPEAYEQYRDLLGLQRRQEMPGMTEQKQLIEEGTAATLSGAQNLDAGGAAAVLLGAGQDRLRALRQLGIAASQYRDTAQQRYTQAVGQGAQYQQQAYEYNQWLPWQMKMNEQMGLRGQGQQMMASGFDQMMGSEIQGADLASQQMWFNRMYPQQGGGPTNASPGINPNWQMQPPPGYMPQMNMPPPNWNVPYNYNIGQ